MEIQELASIVDEAAKNAKAIAQLSVKYEFDVKKAYAIQKASIDRRFERGEELIGWKLGFTSKAKMEQMGVHDMIWGKLTNTMLLENGGAMNKDRYIHPRAEPEICFLIGKTIDKPIHPQEVPDYLESVAAAIEIIDSRYEKFKFSLEDVIADNCSSAGVIVGEWFPPSTPVNHLKITLKVDGAVVHEGSSDAILGDPIESLIAAARLAYEYGEVIPAGSIILAGAATPAVYVQKGQIIKAEVEGLGNLGFTVV